MLMKSRRKLTACWMICETKAKADEMASEAQATVEDAKV